MLLKEYEEKKEEVVSAVVEEIFPDTGNVKIKVGSGYATLLKAEQIPGETFEIGQHIKVYLIEVKKEFKGAFATFSRVHPGLVKRLFELNIPEIADGTLVIMNIAREAGSMQKSYRTQAASSPTLYSKRSYQDPYALQRLLRTDFR